MRILHLSSSDTRGGAARGAYWLHRELRNRGGESLMLVGRKYGDDDSVQPLDGALAPLSERVRNRLDTLPLRRYRKSDESFWTVGWVPRGLKGVLSRFRPDIVHLHWVGGGFLPVGAFRTIPCPIVWTLRDMWAFTGGCHYTIGCRRYETGCGRCPQLRSEDHDDLSRAVWERKKTAWAGLDLWLVPISTWLAECVRQSPLFTQTPIEVIPNGIDGTVFRPVPRAEARRAWRLEPEKTYILFGAFWALQDERKGFRQLVDAMQVLARQCWTSRAELLVFGETAPPETVPDLGLPTRFLGRIDDDSRLAQLYAAANVMVVPSLQEAFGKTVIEAMACGTPVVAFGNGGPVDIIAHRETGYLARPFDATDLAHGIAWCLEDPQRAAAVGRRACVHVHETFDLTLIADRYRDLYRRILEASRRGA